MSDEIRTEPLNNACDEVWELIERHSHFMNKAELDEFTERIHSRLYEVTRARINKVVIMGPPKETKSRFSIEEGKFITANSQVKCSTCTHLGHRHHLANLACEELHCDCNRFTVPEQPCCCNLSMPQDFDPDPECPTHGISTKAEQSSSYYRLAQSERSSQSPALQLSDRFQCKYQHGQTVANQLAHMVNTLKLDLQVELEIDWELFFPSWLALLKCEEVECQAVRKLAALILSNLHPELKNFLPKYREHYFSLLVPQEQLPDFLKSSDPLLPEEHKPDPPNHS